MRSDRTVRSRRKKKTRRRSSGVLGRFFKVFIILIFLLGVVAWAGEMIYTNFLGSGDENSSENDVDGDGVPDEKLELNVAVLGVDKDATRTDVMFVVHFDSQLKKISMLSVPRDTKVTQIAPKVKKIYDEDDRYYQVPTKMNAIHAYGGDKGVECTILQLEDFLGVDIDHYVKFNMEAVVEVVDAFGGVDFYVPMDMYWDMRDTGDILIDLKEGMQHIDGEKALQLLRFRHDYALQDIGRIQTQQDFIHALFEKVSSTENIVKNLPSIIKTVFKYIETDIGLGDIAKYLKYVDTAVESDISMETIPGVGEPVYYIPDEEGKKKVVDTVFYNKTSENEDTKKASYKGKTLRIELSNGGNTKGLAGIKKNMLERYGYNITGISTFNGEKQGSTRVVVKETGVGEELLSYFENAELIVDDSLVGNEYDVKIIFGLDEK